ncbi:unnamed protein product [Mucor circinelloides]
MSQNDDTVSIAIPEQIQGVSYANETQGDQIQSTQSNIEPATIDRHSNESITPIDEAIAANSSSAQEHYQDQGNDSSSTVSVNNREPITIKEALVVDISADKGWVASIVETSDASGASKKLHLRMNKLYDSESKTLDDTGYFIEEEITKHMQQDMNNYYYFLSISSDGERVAISFLPAQELPNKEDKKVELPSLSRCLVFRVDTEAKEVSLENDKLKLQGKAAFQPNGYLALIGKRKIKVYDCKAGYKLVYWFDISPLSYPRKKTYLGNNYLSWANTSLLHTTSSVNQHQESDRPLDQFPAEKCMQLSKLSKHDVLTTTYEGNIIRLWSLKTGCRLTSFQTSTPEVPLAISKDAKYVASFSKSANVTNIYNLKTGLVSNTLRTKSGDDDLYSNRNLDHHRAYAQFCYSGKLLFLIQVRPLEHNNGSNNALITFESWDIAAEKLIFRQAEQIRLNWKAKNSYIEPFVIKESTYYPQPLYTAIYATLADNDSWKFRSLKLTIFKPRTASGENEFFTHNWVPLSHSASQDEDHDIYSELTDNLNEYRNATCFKLRENPNVLLRIGRHTVQLWHMSNLKIRKGLPPQDRLIYICALKAPLYYSDNPIDNFPFDYQWYRRDISMTFTPPIIKSDASTETRSSIEEDETADPQSNQTGAGSLMASNCSNITTQSSSSMSDFIEFWDSLGITFHDNTLENMLSIEICEFLDGSSHTNMEIYLPLGNLTSESYNVCTEYHYVESAINALYYIRTMPENQRTKNSKILYNKTRDLVIRCIDKMRKEKSGYFTTISGSNSLALLASFTDGRSILFQVIRDEETAISLFSYVAKSAETDEVFRTESRNENALTILIGVRDFVLYDLLLNRVLLHTQKLGEGSFSAVADSLVFLQSRGDTDILKNSCQKLQFLHIERNSIITEEINSVMPFKTLHKNLKTEFADLKPSSTNEQILRYDNYWKDRLLYNWFCSLEWTWLRLRSMHFSLIGWYILKHRQDITEAIIDIFFRNLADPGQTAFCVVPYVYLCTYDIYGEDKENDRDHSNRDYKTVFWKALSCLYKRLKLRNDSKPASDQPEDDLSSSLLTSLKKRIKRLESKKLTYKKESTLLQLALNQHENDLFSQERTVLEALLHFKWRRKIKYRFFLICFIHAVYYVSFSVGVLFSREVFDYVPGMPIANNPKHMATVTLMLVSCSVLWLQEARQFFKMGLTYWNHSSFFYNFVDLVALILPIVNLSQMLTSSPGLDELSAITTIILWLHGVLRLRAFAFIGVAVETIIQLIKSVYKTLLIMLLVIVAFTNAFIVLLARKNDAYFQKQYSGSIDLNNSGSSAENTVSYNDDSASNNFKHPVKAFSTLWFFIFGVWDPINDGDAGDDYMIMALAILFSFLTVVLFFNLVIALMSSRAEEIKALGKSVWLSHFAGRNHNF